MDIHAPAAALAPFMDGTITLRPYTRTAEIVAPVEVAACVRESDPFLAGQNPSSPAPNSWTVSLFADALPEGAEIVPGATIDESKEGGWPRLTVVSLARNGAVIHLSCRGRQR